MNRRFNITCTAFLSLLLLLVPHPELSAQKKDSLERLMGKNYKLQILGFSNKGSWVMAEKRYGHSSDSTFIFSTHGKGSEAGTIIRMKGSRVFLKEEAVLSSGGGKAEYRNLKTGSKTAYHNIKRATGLPATGMYSVLDQENKISVYDLSGKRLYSINDIEGFEITDETARTYVNRRVGAAHELYDISGTMPQKLYTSVYPLQHVMMSRSKSYLLAVENDPVSGTRKLIAIRTATGQLMQAIIPGMHQDDAPSFTEFGNGTSLFIHGVHHIPRNKMVEIWYGNDGNLQKNEIGSDMVSAYWIMNMKSGKIERLPSEGMQMLPTGDHRHFLAFRAGAVQDYRTLNEHIDMSLYDLETRSFRKLDTIKNGDLYLSSQGSLLAYRSMDNQWIISDLTRKDKTALSREKLRNPAFSDDDGEIYFESDQGLYVYSVRKQSLQIIPETKNQKVKLVNRDRTGFPAGNSHLYRITLKKGSPVVFESRDEDQNTTAYYTLQKGKVRTMIPANPNFISSIELTEDASASVFVEENYTVPPKLVFRKSSPGKLPVVLQSYTGDVKVKSFKQEIIRYSNSEGRPLKGILYYPAGFDASKQYPMVVRIYQVQSDTSNHYHVLGYYNPVAFDLRALVENGYFVYLPDIVFGPQGTGLSALDCVHRGLDAIQDRPYINPAKIGLTGHSHGGYETNFIATHSDRFATYLSGAGNSDIVRSYFSYNYNFHSPFYWQFEDGQYEMPLPFASDKELYFRNNPIHYSEKVNAPILLWAGKKDKNIAWDQVMEFYIGLKRHQKDVVALFYPDQGHALGLSSPEKNDLYYKALDWWDYFLKDKKNIPWIDRQMKKDAL
ncbi:S9 family peptidase [Chryseobacterium gregarium]|uniref:S9 family peptidase n=1 Tax=Chryseobacterium gregarium TaxID=456299 RepID=UPI00040449DD|nr:prolyl oligopeptidase family serine peptidase [Chryseobacterium gregarium]